MKTFETKEEVLAELKKRGIELSVETCGCCGGASTQVKIDGKLVTDKFGNYIDIREPEFD